MTPKQFEYVAAKSLPEAISLLQTKEEAKLLAGGQSLLALMKLRLAAPKTLIDITPLSELVYVKDLGPKGLAIGALTTQDEIEHHPVIRRRYLALAEGVSKIGDQQIRNRGTIGGSAVHADPAADMLGGLRAFDAEFVAVGPKGERVIAADKFFVDYFTTALEAHEVLREIRFPQLPPRTGSAYLKLSRREGDFAIAAATAVLTLDGRGVCKRAAIGLGAVGSTPLRATAVEKVLVGKKLSDQVIEKAAQLADQGTDPPSDIHGSAEYRREMAKVMTKRAAKLAWQRAKGGRAK